MASKQRSKSYKNSFVDDDLLDDLLRDNEYLASGKPTRGEVIKNSSFNDDFFQKLAEEAERDGSNVVDSDVSEADPDDILKKMKDMDDLDAALFGSKRKPSSAPPQTKPFDSSGAKKDPPKSETNVKPRETDEPILEGKKPNSAPSSTAHGYKKFTFSDDDDDNGDGDGEHFVQTTSVKDLDDPLANVLDDLLPEETKKEPKASIQKTQPEKSGLSPSMFPIQKKKETGPKKKEELIFNDDEGDLMDALGFDSEKEPSKKKETMLHQDRESSEPKQRARTRLDEILERGTSPRLLERPPTGERKNQSQPPEKPQQEKISSAKEEDFTFLSYQPTLVSTPEGRQSGKQTVRFSTEDISSSTPERKPKPSTPTTPTTSTRSRTSADWLGLKTNNDYNYQDEDIKEPKSEPETSKIPTSPVVERRRSLSGSCATPAKTKVETSATTSANPPKTEVAESQKKEEEEDDWLTGALSRKKALAASNSDTRRSKQEDSLGLGDEVDLDSLLSKQVSSSLIKGREEDTFTAIKEPGETSQRQPRPTAQFTPVRDKPKQDPLSPTQSPSLVTQHTPISQPALSPHHALASAPPTALPIKVDPHPHLQAAGPIPVSDASVSHPQPLSKPQSQPHQHPPLQDSEASGWSSKAADLSANYQPLQWQPLSSSMSTTLPCSMWLPQQNQMQNIAPAGQQQLTISSDSLQQLLLQQQLIQSQLLGQGGPLDAGSLPRWKEREQKYEDHQALQARIIQLDGQVKTLHLERDQSQMLLENIQQRHKQDMELMENTHKARVKMLEESAAQREAQARRECEDLIERLATVTQQAEQQRSELQAQHQRRLAQVQQDRDREVERLRDLQRKSILEMKKDHEDQVQRLKRLKDDEIDAVTSATSQTRSLTVVIEQMEQFSQRLGDLSSRVESTHEHTAQGLEQGARQRDEQLRVMQNRLDQQQRAMTEERARLKEVITRMDTQLAEQQRQLEKERWKVAAEQAKAESAQRSLEEERRSLTMHINMEREELERAKSALLEEQQSVMQHCAEERRKLAAEWSQFHSQEKQRLEMAEREASRAMERDAHRQNSIISMAQEQADLKLRAGELKQKEEAVAHERETLAREKEELEREKGRLSSTALKLKTRAQEVEAFSKLASEKYEEGEQALQEARHVESEHQARLRTIHSQIERLRQQEHYLHQERIRVTDIQKETERLRQGFPITPLPHVPLIPAQNFVLSNPEMAYIPNAPPPTLISSPGSVELQARLALLKHTAEKDRDYLQDEQFFLDTLKKASNNSAHTD